MTGHEYKLLFIPASEIRTYEFPDEFLGDGWSMLSSSPVSGDNGVDGIAVIFSRPNKETQESFSIVMGGGMERETLSKKDLFLVAAILLAVLVIVSYTIYVLAV